MARLGTEKFMLDGRHTGTGGGNHVTLGGATPADSPLLRRPDLLRSLIAYWQQPSRRCRTCSPGMFIGPTSQAPRVDEARDDRLYELEIAFQQIDRVAPHGRGIAPPWLVDRLLRHLLIDLTGNTHRAEFSIDKLYSPDSATGRLGLVEFRAFEMPPHCADEPRAAAAAARAGRAVLAHAVPRPAGALGHRAARSLHAAALRRGRLRDVVDDLRRDGYPFEPSGSTPFVEFRFPRFGTVDVRRRSSSSCARRSSRGTCSARRRGTAGTARYVDSSVERLQVKVTGMIDRPPRGHVQRPRGAADGDRHAGRVRRRRALPRVEPAVGAASDDSRARAAACSTSSIRWSQRAIGGCTYHVAHPGGRNYETFPVNANEAESRRLARFWPHGHTPGPVPVHDEPRNPALPTTLDLRWNP